MVPQNAHDCGMHSQRYPQLNWLHDKIILNTFHAAVESWATAGRTGGKVGGQFPKLALRYAHLTIEAVMRQAISTGKYRQNADSDLAQSSNDQARHVPASAASSWMQMAQGKYIQGYVLED